MAKRGNIRGSRWATIIIVIVVIAMAGSTLPFFLGNFISGARKSGDLTPDAFKQSIQEVKEQLEQQAKQLEDYIDEYGPTEATLANLAGIYYQLINYQDILDPEKTPPYQEKLLQTYQDLVELAPDNLEYRFNMVLAYQGVEKEEEARAEAEALMEVLEPRLEENPDNRERYYYAVLLGEFEDDPEAALEILNVILETEHEGSGVYNSAGRYKDELEARLKEQEDKN
ncbi:MAG TPA: hypothetical protein PLS32_05695 [Bacillota bacterium]|nr:hypothetical protein [Bacillota bacterium]HPT34112.1 hypothetical protein [Bacillota bacterium]HQD05860.1 hypothetical protein [Bacillota bacterium]